jgi:hypothetical protein
VKLKVAHDRCPGKGFDRLDGIYPTGGMAVKRKILAQQPSSAKQPMGRHPTLEETVVGAQDLRKNGAAQALVRLLSFRLRLRAQA